MKHVTVFLESFGFANRNSVIFYSQKLSDYVGIKYKEAFGRKHRGFL